MIKRLIFDIDDTLIEYIYYEQEKQFIINNFKNIDINKFYEIYNKYLEICDGYDIDELYNYLNNHMDISYDLVSKLIKNSCNNIPDKINKEVIETLDYLSSKYELVILSNWFKESQLERLKRLNIDKYFKEFYMGKEIRKPNRQAFIKACDKYKPCECVMIGDSIVLDIKGAHNVGIKGIHCNFKNEQYNDEYKHITSFSELKELL